VSVMCQNVSEIYYLTVLELHMTHFKFTLQKRKRENWRETDWLRFARKKGH